MRWSRVLPVALLVFTGCAGKGACVPKAGQKVICLDKESRHRIGSRKKRVGGTYEKERAGITAKLIREPAIPMRVPDTILRALVYPYSSKNGTLHMATYIYLKVEDGRWILGEYLERTGSADRVIKPLSKTVKEKK